MHGNLTWLVYDTFAFRCEESFSESGTSSPSISDCAGVSPVLRRLEAGRGSADCGESFFFGGELGRGWDWSFLFPRLSNPSTASTSMNTGRERFPGIARSISQILSKMLMDFTVE